MKRIFAYSLLALAAMQSSLLAVGLSDSLKKGNAHIGSAGPIAFAPEGILLVADPKNATVVAIATGDISGTAASASYSIDQLDEKIAGALGTNVKSIQIVDIASNPLSGNVYLSVSRGQGPDAKAIVMRVKPDGTVEEVPTQGVATAQAQLPNAPDDKAGKRGNPRNDSITDMAFVDGQVYVAGLSNEEFASKLRSLPFPFAQANSGASVEIYHGAHGALETHSPVRTFAAYEINGTEHLIAAYQCTPLVKIPVGDLAPGKKVRGTTIAELGNRNRPLDMVIYKKDGKDFVLLANSARGVMKISTDRIENQDPINSRIANTAGLPYATIEGLGNVVQLDRLNDKQAVILVQAVNGPASLKSIDLP